MIVARAQTAPVAEAVATTFDGDHPCGLCKAISQGQESEQKQQPAAPLVKKSEDLKLVAQARIVPPPATAAAEILWPELVACADSRTEQPPTPPPLA
jgi:hypothetical protein